MISVILDRATASTLAFHVCIPVALSSLAQGRGCDGLFIFLLVSFLLAWIGTLSNLSEDFLGSCAGLLRTQIANLGDLHAHGIPTQASCASALAVVHTLVTREDVISNEGIRPNERRSHRIDTWPVTPDAFSKGRRCSAVVARCVGCSSRDCLATCSAQTQVSLDPLPKQSLLQEDKAPVATARKGGASRNQSTIDRFENSTAWSGRLP